MHTPVPRALAPRTVSLAYPGTAEHIRAVRADLRGLLGDCPMADDVILCASELAANAAIHSRSRLPGGVFTVRATISSGNYTWVEVEDSGGPWAPGISDSTRRHGLDIVRALASDWGIDGDDTVRTIWARFRLAKLRMIRGTRIARFALMRVRTFFTTIKGTPSARRAVRPWPRSDAEARAHRVSQDAA
jgi:serine/threonine-protein kinase RsbW